MKKYTKQETYTLAVHCTNCGWGKHKNITPTGYGEKGMVEIEKGVSFAHWRIYNSCPKCGCEDLQVD